MSRNKQTNRGLAHAKFSFERLEPRLVLDGDFTFAPHQFVPDTPQEQAIADKAGTDLAWLYTDYQDWQASGESEPFTTFSPAMGQLGFAVQDANVAIEAYANQDAASIEGALAALGFQEQASYGRGVDGWFPIASIGSFVLVQREMEF